MSGTTGCKKSWTQNDEQQRGTTGTLTWTLEKDTLTISGVGAMLDYFYPDYAPWYSNSLSISAVIIGDSITSIGSSAFFRCSNLTSITVPDSLTSIGTAAFYRCSSLTAVTIPKNVKSIGAYAFARCSNLTSVTVLGKLTNIGKDAFPGCDSLTAVSVSGGSLVVKSNDSNPIDIPAADTIYIGKSKMQKYEYPKIEKPVFISDTIIIGFVYDYTIGDFNGDFIPDTAWFINPTERDYKDDYFGEYTCYIRFSDPCLPIIQNDRYEIVTGYALGDLDGNGTDEIYVRSGAYYTPHENNNVWTFHNSRWKNFVEPSSFLPITLSEDEVYYPIQKHPKKTGYVLVSYSDYDSNSKCMVLKTKSVYIGRKFFGGN
jgi:hypothetical protein